MKKKFIFFPIIILIIGVGLIYFLTQQRPKKRELITELTPLQCDLNKQDCEVSYKGKTLVFSISKRPLNAMEEFDLKVSNLDNCEKLSAKIYGLNMYMGSVVPKFRQSEEGCITRAVLSTCTLKTMRFRIELFEGKKSLGIYSDLDLIR